MMNFSWEQLATAFEDQRNFCGRYSPLCEAIFAQTNEFSRKQVDNTISEPEERAFVELLETEWAERILSTGTEASLLISGAIHAAVLNDEAPALERFFATVGGSYDAEMDRDVLHQMLAGFYMRPPDTAREFLRSGVIQTNEISRGVVWLLPALMISKRNGSQPITLVDLGCSVGLNLAADAYRWYWTFSDAADGDRIFGGEAPLLEQTIRVEDPSTVTVLSDPLPSLNIARRVGFDLQPPHIENSRELLFLRACIWGDQPERLTRFDDAIKAMRGVMPPLEIIQADMIEAARNLHTLITPDTKVLIVYDTAVTLYFDDAMYGRLRANIQDSFAQLPDGVDALWIEHSPTRDGNSIPENGLFPVIINKLDSDGNLRATIYAYTEPHPRAVRLLSGWSDL